MRSLACFALSMSTAVAFLAGCGGLQAPIGVPSVSSAGRSFTHSRTFSYSGREQAFTVPRHVREIAVVARGGGGATGPGSYSRPGAPIARGGRVYAIISVTPGERLHVYVGGAGSGASGGFNGGASGGASGSCNCSAGYAGGGASDVRQGGNSLADRVVVAAGGGGAGGTAHGYGNLQTGGGFGGGLVGGNGGGDASEHGGGGGGGGSQSAGGGGGGGGSFYGYNGDPGASGTLGAGGAGGSGAPYGGGGGGGGGGGYYGGGGGGAGGGRYFGYCYECVGGGGGGGSSYIEPSAKNARTWRGWHKAFGNGLVVFSW